MSAGINTSRDASAISHYQQQDAYLRKLQENFGNPENIFEFTHLRALDALVARIFSINSWKEKINDHYCHFHFFLFLNKRLYSSDGRLHEAKQVRDLTGSWDFRLFQNIYFQFVKEENEPTGVPVDRKITQLRASASYFSDTIEILHHFPPDDLPPVLSQGSNQILLEHKLMSLWIQSNTGTCKNDQEDEKIKLKSAEYPLLLPHLKLEYQLKHLSLETPQMPLPSLRLNCSDEEVIEQLLKIDHLLSTAKDKYILRFAKGSSPEESNLTYLLIQSLQILRANSNSKEVFLETAMTFSIPYHIYDKYVRQYPILALPTSGYQRLYHLFRKLLIEFGKKYEIDLHTFKDVSKEDISLLTRQLEDFGTLFYREYAAQNALPVDPPMILRVIDQKIVNGKLNFSMQIDASNCALFKRTGQLASATEEEAKQEFQKRFTILMICIKQWGLCCGVEIVCQQVKLAQSDASFRAFLYCANEIECLDLSHSSQLLSLGGLSTFPAIKELKIDWSNNNNFLTLMKKAPPMRKEESPEERKASFTSLLQFTGDKPSSVKKLSMSHVGAVERNDTFWLLMDTLFPKVEEFVVTQDPSEKILGINDPVLLSSMVQGKILPCGHVFSFSSIHSINKCPFDRTTFNQNFTLPAFNPAKTLFFKRENTWFAHVVETSGKSVSAENSQYFYHNTCGEIIGQDTLSKVYNIHTTLSADETKKSLLKCECQECHTPFTEQSLTKVFLNGAGEGTSVEEGFKNLTAVSAYKKINLRT